MCSRARSTAGIILEALNPRRPKEVIKEKTRSRGGALDGVHVPKCTSMRIVMSNIPGSIVSLTRLQAVRPRCY